MDDVTLTEVWCTPEDEMLPCHVLFGGRVTKSCWALPGKQLRFYLALQPAAAKGLKEWLDFKHE